MFETGTSMVLTKVFFFGEEISSLGDKSKVVTTHKKYIFEKNGSKSPYFEKKIVEIAGFRP